MATLGSLYVKTRSSLDPSSHPDELFELFSVPAYSERSPERLKGDQIGSTKQVVQPGDVLVCKIVPHIRRSWVVPPDTGVRQIASSEWIVLRGASFEPSYLRHFLLSDQFHAQFMQTIAGIGGSLMRARPASAARIEVPLPPLPEQRRIAAILDQADALRAKRRRSMGLFDDVARTAFAEVAFQQDVTVLPLEQVVNAIETGKSLASPVENTSNVVSRRILKISAVTSGRYLAAESKPLPETYSPPMKHYVQRGDILVSRANTAELVGASAIVNSEEPRVLPDKLWRIVPREQLIEPIYLHAAISSPHFRSMVTRTVGGSSGSMKNISQSAYLSLPIPVPAYESQQRFSALITGLEGARSTATRQLQASEVLFSSLQDRAFRGAL